MVNPEDGLLPVENIGIPYVWMDHIAFKKQKHKQLAFNLYVAGITGKYLTELSLLSGEKETAEQVKAFSAYLLANCVKKFWSEEEKVFVDNKPWMEEEKEVRYSDRALATALLFHQCPGNDEKRSLEILKSFPENLGISYPCNAVWRYWALAENGEMGAFMDDLRNKWGKMPSVWENNTLQEDWNATHNSSSQWSHSAVAPIVILYQGLAGAMPLTPGGTKYRIWPKPGDLSLIETAIQTASGAIRFKTEGLKGNRTLSLEVPEGTEVELWLDSREKTGLPEIPGGPDSIKKYRLSGGSKVSLKLRFM
jgi:hypothetical protein